MAYYLTLCRGCTTRWPDGEFMTGMIDNEADHLRCDGCGHVADALAMVKFSPEDPRAPKEVGS